MKGRKGVGMCCGLAVLFAIASVVSADPAAPPTGIGSRPSPDANALEWSVPEGVSDTIVVPVTDEALMAIVKEALSTDGTAPEAIRKIDVGEYGAVYRATFAQAEPIFARFVARRVPCGDCHDVFFVYSFDGHGILKFVPVSITKRYNKKWDAQDIEKIENRFVGKAFQDPVPFNPFVDAVSSATMSSKIVFYCMNETRAVYQKLVEKGLAERCKKGEGAKAVSGR